jgi:hypothetical protein
VDKEDKMFSREVTNDYGSYSRVNDSTILFKGVFDKNFRELKTIDPNTATYKVFNCPSQSINFAVKLGSSTYIPQHLFDRLVTAYKENNPYYTINDLVILEMELTKIISFIENKYGGEVETNTITYIGSTSAFSSSVVDGDTTTSITSSTTTVTANARKETSSRLELAGVTQLGFQFYKDNDPDILNEENIIKHILFIFEETNIRISGTYKNVLYQNADESVIIANLPASTDVVKPVTKRVTSMDDYLKDVVRE